MRCAFDRLRLQERPATLRWLTPVLSLAPAMHWVNEGNIRHTYLELEKAGEWLGRPIVSVRTARELGISNFSRPPPEDKPAWDVLGPWPRPQTAVKSVVRVLPTLLDLAVSFSDLELRDSDAEDGDSTSSSDSSDLDSPSAALKSVKYLEPLFLPGEPLQLEIRWDAFPYHADSWLGELWPTALDWQQRPLAAAVVPAVSRPSRPSPALRGRGKGKARRPMSSSSLAGSSRGRGRGRGRVLSPPHSRETPAEERSDSPTGETPFVFPVGWLGYQDPAFFTRGGGIPLLHLELWDRGLRPEWPSAIRAVVNEFGPRWIYIDRHSGVSMAGPLALGGSVRPVREGRSGWEPVLWKGESRGYDYDESVTLSIALSGNPDLKLCVWCAFVNSFGPTVVLSRDFVLAHGVWIEFDHAGRSLTVYIRGQAFPCEPAERARSPRR